jgi:hypothetical protein
MIGVVGIKFTEYPDPVACAGENGRLGASASGKDSPVGVGDGLGLHVGLTVAVRPRG